MVAELEEILDKLAISRKRQALHCVIACVLTFYFYLFVFLYSGALR